MNTTGIKGKELMIDGLLWETLRPFAMKLIVPFDSITIDLNENEQKILTELIKL